MGIVGFAGPQNSGVRMILSKRPNKQKPSNFCTQCGTAVFADWPHKCILAKNKPKQ